MLPHFGPLGASLGWCLTSFDGKSPSTSNHNFRAFQLSDFNQLMVVSFPWWLSARKCMYLPIIKVSLWLHLFCVGLNEAWVLIRSPKDNIRVSGLTSTTWWLWGTELRLTSAWVAFSGGPPRWCIFVVRNYPLCFLFIFRYSLLSVWLLSSYQYPQPKVSRAFLNFPTMPLQHNFRCWEFQFPARPVHPLICFISKHTDHSFGVAIAVRLPARWQLQRNHVNSAFVWGDRSPRDALLSAVVPNHGSAFLWPFAASVLDSAAHGSSTCCFRFARTAHF